MAWTFAGYAMRKKQGIVAAANLGERDTPEPRDAFAAGLSQAVDFGRNVRSSSGPRRSRAGVGRTDRAMLFRMPPILRHFRRRNEAATGREVTDLIQSAFLARWRSEGGENAPVARADGRPRPKRRADHSTTLPRWRGAAIAAPRAPAVASRLRGCAASHATLCRAFAETYAETLCRFGTDKTGPW